jgi:hypothetical protein
MIAHCGGLVVGWTEVSGQLVLGLWALVLGV